jgi:putative peptide zinc metalloprotease protein
MTITHRHPLKVGEATDTSRDLPKLAEGMDLLGAAEGTGYVEPHFLARRDNGSVISLSHLLHLVADASDGQRDLGEIAAKVSNEFGKTVSADNVRVVVDEKLRPLGVLAARDGTSPEIPEPDPFLALKFRTGLLGPRAVRAMCQPFRPLFFLPVVLVACGGVLAFDLWLFLVHGLAQGVRETMNQPVLFLMALGIVVVSAAFHELGHATACVYSGASPGRMGAGVYLAWPAFYTDVTDAYRLDRKGRLRTDLGGIYFNGLFVLALGGLYLATGFEPLLLIAFLLQIEVVHQLLPFLRLDGYYVVSDLVGVPDLFRRIGPILRSSLPWRRQEKEVAELKPWVRFFVRLWVFLVVPILLFNLAIIVVSTPRIIATAWDSSARLIGQMQAGGVVVKVIAVIEIVFLALPILGIGFTFLSMGWRFARASWSWSSGSRVKRSGVLLVTAGVAAAMAAVWWPNQTYTPYRPGERGTLQQGVRDSVSSVGTGTPLFRSPTEAQHPLPPAKDPVTNPASTSGGATTPQPGAGDTAPGPGPAVSPSASPIAAPTASARATPSASPTPTATAQPSTTPTATNLPSPAAT